MCEKQKNEGVTEKNILPGIALGEEKGGLFLRKRANQEDRTDSTGPKKSLLGLDVLARERKKLQEEESFKTPRVRANPPPSASNDGRAQRFSHSHAEKRDRNVSSRRYRTQNDTPGASHEIQVSGRDRWHEEVRNREMRHPLYATTQHSKHETSRKRDDNSSSRRQSSRRETSFTPTPDSRLRKQMLTPSRATWDDKEQVTLTELNYKCSSHPWFN